MTNIYDFSVAPWWVQSPDSRWTNDYTLHRTGISSTYTNTDSKYGRSKSVADFGINVVGSSTASTTYSDAWPLTAPSTTYTTSHAITDSDKRTLVYESTVSGTFTLPSVGAGDDGQERTFMRADIGALIIQASDSDKIADSSPGGTIVCSDEDWIFASITLRYIHEVGAWFIVSATGPWTTA